ncbi:glycosyltransferase family 4 protein [Cyclobacterium sp. 1_MG-2023]|uniref:glycosyltransferase family 4 protein n=1 Tax=Cyclobacterium sp. 1_MG-2023 TaxID=3062681 RepID=UPI0026E13EF5|nr:glycosyltransferase family 4 protein [Cyclobacterium sp. 1_MG-2023]MDO6439168.1 glycosyltransferase family 4 protein [Cyclobacterium sp. 1_MG-2023]
MKKRNLLFLPKYPRKGASSRLRTFQFLPLWEKMGYSVSVHSFFTEQYLNNIYSHQSPGYWHVMKCYFRRFFLLFTVHKYDLIIIEKEIFPYLPAIAEWMLAHSKGYWVDYDDAVFHNYDLSNNRMVRLLMPKKIDQVMKLASKVVVGNEYLKNRAIMAGALNVAVFPTVVNTNRYKEKICHTTSKSVTIGWIGSPSTLKYLEPMVPVLNWLHQHHPIKFLLVNGKSKIKFEGKLESIPWTEEGEVDAILKMDIGIMPLPDSPWENGKCAYKLIQYMGCGLPVVASPIGMNNEVVNHGENGFLACTSEEWISALEKLILDPQLRKEFGKKGRDKILREYTLQGNFMRYIKLVETELGDK